MKSNTYNVAKIIEHDYWRTQGDSDLGNGLYSDGDGNVHDVKYMNQSLKLISTYYRNQNQIQNNVINPLKKISSLLHEYTAVIGYIPAQSYKLTIIANRRQLHTHSHYLLDPNDNLATDDLHSAVMRLRHYMSRHKSSWKIRVNYPHITYREGLHTHGWLTSPSHHYKHEATLMTAYLNNYLPFDVTVAINPLKNSDQENASLEDFNAIEQWLNYAHRSGKLAFPSTKNPAHYLAEWNKLSQQSKSDYVQACFNSLNGKHAHYNYTFSFKGLIHKIRAYIQTVYVLARIRFIMHEANVIEEPTLFRDDYTNNPQSSPVNSHHYTSSEQWARATKEQMRDNHRIIILGSKRLYKATSNGIHKIIRANKKAVPKGSNGIHTQIILIINDRLLFSGIPP